MYQSITDLPRPLQTLYAQQGDCWTYTGQQKQTYPKRPKELGGNQFTHRWIYESIWGELPRYKRIIHNCNNTRCINPWHLNLKYDHGKAKLKARKRGDIAKCGHPFNAKTTEGWRYCGVCFNAYGRRRKQRATKKEFTMEQIEGNWKQWSGRRTMRKMVLERDQHTCHYCAGPANTVDHVISQATWFKLHGDLVGCHDLDNLVAACGKCNFSKQDKSVGSFLSFQGTAKTPVSNLSPTTVLRHSSPFQVPR